ncbi:MAG: T9SS C-terminal target domain-containing protein, partial [Bacteroidetes bacterium]
ASILELYPNPASSILNLKLKPGAEAPDQLAIINTLGQVVLQSAFSESLDLSGIADGVYYLQLRKENSKELYLQKFIVHKP